MIISGIVACDLNHVIGLRGHLPWSCPADLQHFRKKTLNHPVIMGRKTYQSIGKPLDKRINIVLSKQKLAPTELVLVFENFEEVLTYCKTKHTEEVFIIGGEQLFNFAFAHKIMDRLFITRIHNIFNGDTFLKPLEVTDWLLKEIIPYEPNEKSRWYLTFEQWERIK